MIRPVIGTYAAVALTTAIGLVDGPEFAVGAAAGVTAMAFNFWLHARACG